MSESIGKRKGDHLTLCATEDVGFRGATTLFARESGQLVRRRWTHGAQLNTDADLRLSYLAGWGINSALEDTLYRKMMQYRNPRPQGIFFGSPERLHAVYEGMMREAYGGQF